MKSSFEIEKIKAVILYILKKKGGEIDYVSLFKVMYFAQRKYLVNYGRTIFNDSFRAYQRGPVPSFTFKVIKSIIDNSISTSSKEIKEFSANFQVVTIPKGVFIKSNEEPDMDYIAEAEVKVLNKVIKKTESYTIEQLSDKSHEDNAWIVANERAQKDPSDNYMRPLSIAESAGASKEMLEYIKDNQLFSEFCKA